MEALITLVTALLAVAAFLGGGLSLRSIKRARAERDRTLQGIEEQLGEVLRTARRTEVAHANVDQKLAAAQGETGTTAAFLGELRADHVRRQDFEQSMTAVGSALRELLTRMPPPAPPRVVRKRQIGRPE